MDEIGLPGLAIKAKAYSLRTFFVLNPDPEVEERVRSFSDGWKDLRVCLHISTGVSSFMAGFDHD